MYTSESSLIRMLTAVLVIFFSTFVVDHAIAQVRTEHIGVRFRQEGKILPIRRDGSEESVVEMRREAFEILLSADIWQTPNDEYPALMVVVSNDPEVFTLAKLEGSSEELLFFQPGYGMADAEHGSGRLFSIDLNDRPFAFNYVYGPRFNINEPKIRGFYVAMIEDHEEHDQMKSAASLYMVFHLDPTESAETEEIDDLAPTRFDPLNVDLVRVNFID